MGNLIYFQQADATDSEESTYSKTHTQLHSYPTVYRVERRMVYDLARKLSVFHDKGNGSFETELRKTYFGLLAEYATTKFFNYHLGAQPAVNFNRSYVNGFDGGFDFRLEGIRIDVKYSRDEKGLPAAQIVDPSRADVYVLVNRIPKIYDDGLSFHVVGYLPSRFVPSDRSVFISRTAFKPIYELKRALPHLFRDAIPYGPPPRRAQKIAEILPLTIDQLINPTEKFDVSSLARQRK